MTQSAMRKALIVAAMGAFVGAIVLVFALSPKTPGPAPETTAASAVVVTPTAVVAAAPAEPAQPAVATARSAPLAVKLPPTAVVTTIAGEVKLTSAAAARAPTGPAMQDGMGSARQANADIGSRHTEPMLPAETTLSATPELDIHPAVSDNFITSDVKSQFAADAVGKDVDIGVTTTQGAVVLTGTLGSQAAIEHVKAVAERVKDVKSVDVTALKIASL